MFRIKISSLIAATVVSTFACSGGSQPASDTPSPTPATLLQHIPDHDIDGSTTSEKIELAPADASPPIKAEAAIQKARAAGGTSGDVLETILVSYTNLVGNSPAPRLAWVINYDPATVPAFPPAGCHSDCPNPEDVHTGYAYTLIDATTGEFLYSESSSYFPTFTPRPAAPPSP